VSIIDLIGDEAIASSAAFSFGHAGRTKPSTRILPSGPWKTRTLPPGPVSSARRSVSFVVTIGAAAACARLA